MTLQEIILHFSNAKQTGSNQYAVNCPACGDTNRHLYIAEAEGKLLLDCKKGCSFADIVQASGLKKSDFFNRVGESCVRPNKWTKLREHIYTDTEGNPIARKTIYDKGGGCTAKEAYDVYKKWCSDCGYFAEGKQKFMELMRGKKLLKPTATLNGKTAFNVIPDYAIICSD